LGRNLPKWLRSLIGEDYFQEVVHAYLKDTVGTTNRIVEEDSVKGFLVQNRHGDRGVGSHGNFRDAQSGQEIAQQLGVDALAVDNQNLKTAKCNRIHAATAAEFVRSWLRVSGSR